VLRFWRGNNNTLWNYSIEISYEQYLNNQNCIVVKDWDNFGHCTYYFNAKICLDFMLQIGFIDMELYSNMLDVDGDGLLLEEEYKYGTLPSEKDTDGDGLSDYNEIYLYGTNPTNIDSDNDGISDGTEIDMGLNPLNFDTDNNGIADGNEILRQTIKNVSFDKMKDNEIVPEISIVGNVYDFRHDEDLEFEKCELIFNINKVIKNYDELAVAYYNEETNQIEILETHLDSNNNILTCSVEHLSIYFVVDVAKFISGWYVKNLNDVVLKGRSDIVFVVDTTGSMSNAISQVKNSIESFADELENNKVDVRLGLIEYKDIYYDGVNSTKYYGWYEKVSDFKHQINHLNISGGGDAPESLVDAINIMQINLKFRSDADKYAIIVTDAAYKDGIVNDVSECMSNKIEQLVNDNINVSVITSKDLFGTYNSLTEKTNGILGNINLDF